MLTKPDSNFYLQFGLYLGGYDITKYGQKYPITKCERKIVKLDREDIQNINFIYNALNSFDNSVVFINTYSNFGLDHTDNWYDSIVLKDGYSIKMSDNLITIKKGDILPDWNLIDFQLEKPIELNYPIFIFKTIELQKDNRKKQLIDVITNEKERNITTIQFLKNDYFHNQEVIDSEGNVYWVENVDFIKFKGLHQFLFFLKDKRKVVIDFIYKSKIDKISLEDFKERIILTISKEYKSQKMENLIKLENSIKRSHSFEQISDVIK